MKIVQLRKKRTNEMDGAKTKKKTENESETLFSKNCHNLI